MSLAEALNMGFSFMFDYYKSDAWNENKIVNENNETMRNGIITRLNSLIKLLNGRKT